MDMKVERKSSHASGGGGHGGMGGSYGRFIAMIVAGMAVMYAITYLNTYAPAHVRFSEMRLYMNLIMGGAMALVMLGFMLNMYRNAARNWAIVIGGLFMMALGLFLARSQTLVDDASWMKSMIPHHSIAILTSERAEFVDARVQALAAEIIEAQEREIAEMEWLLDDIAANGPALTDADATARAVPDF